MGEKILKRYSYKSQPKVFKLLLISHPNFLHKTNFIIFENEILKIFVRFRYNGTQWE